jgi:hypothetical protein
MQGWFMGGNKYHEPLLPPWVTVYWMFILKYFWNTWNKNIFKNLENFYCIVVLWFT